MIEKFFPIDLPARVLVGGRGIYLRENAYSHPTSFECYRDLSKDVDKLDAFEGEVYILYRKVEKEPLGGFLIIASLLKTSSKVIFPWEFVKKPVPMGLRVDLNIVEAIQNWIVYGFDPGICTRLLLEGKYGEAKLHAHSLILPHWEDHIKYVESLLV